LPDPLLRARTALEAAAADYLAIPDAALTKVWLFRGVDPEDGVRYGIYRGGETIEVADAELEVALAGAPARAPGAIRSAPATIARWALQGRLAALGDTMLDRELPPESSEAEGSVADIRARLDQVLDEWALRVAALDDSALAASAMWSGVPVDVDFRIGRWASHIREHTLQIDKTLDWLGYQPSEPARIVRDMLTTWGRLEARIFPVAPAGTDAAVAKILARCAEQLLSD